ncbi:MAG: T9SS type A sorting domain-containing protein [Bacteroidales bacterium]|nr:T9SS type A sorting domain-containing protein [Bacteroidales bacterium]
MKSALLSILLMVCGIPINAQQAISSSGGNASGSGGSVSYSVGQVAYTNQTGSNGSAIQGVQQPFEISVETSIEEANDVSLEFVVYPNPVTDYLILKINGIIETRCIASLYNINGIILQTIKVETNETTIPMQGYSSGTYFLKLSKTMQNFVSTRVIKTFKIVKH